MIVRCINDDFSMVPLQHPIHNVIKVGDELPMKGKEYEVIGYSTIGLNPNSGWSGYELAELDYSNYPFKTLLFKKERFEIVDDTFVPNMVTEEGFPARRETMYLSFSIPDSKISKMPRKMKKRFKKYGMCWTYNKKKK